MLVQGFIYGDQLNPIAELDGAGTVVATFTGTGRVLVMDDEPIMKELIGTILNELGYEPELTENGEEVLALFTKEKEAGRDFRVVMLDLTIKGGMGGKETMGRLLEIDPDIKGIVSSVYSNDPVMADHKKYGFSGVISKPYTIQKLSNILNRVLENEDE